MPGTVNSLLVLGKFRQLVEELYGEPKNEEIVGLYFHADINNHPPVPVKINKKIKKIKKCCNQKDIRNLFVNASGSQRKSFIKNKKKRETISVD